MTTDPGDPPILADRLVHLSIVTADDAEGLLPSATDPEVWRWKLVPRPETVHDLRRVIEGSLLGPGRWPFAIRRRPDGVLIGSTTLANFDLHHGRVEMGFTWLDRGCWGQGYNEAAKHLLLEHCFGPLGLHRVEWQVDASNVRSQRSLERFGLVAEGTLRGRHLRPDGVRRDSIMYGLLADDWPAFSQRLLALIAERASPTGP